MSFRYRLAGLIPLLLVLLGAAPQDEVEDWVRQGNEAFAREDFDAAIQFYERAAVLSTDPGQVAFNEGAAYYRLGDYRQSEQHFRQALEDATGLRRARALYNLGNSLVRRAGPRDVEVLREAVGCYEACLREGNADPDLIVDARDNLKVAREVLALAEVARKNNPDPKDPRDDDPDNPRHPRNSMPRGDGQDPSDSTRGMGNDPGANDANAGQKPIPVGEQPQPGAGKLPVLRDGDSPPMTPQETEAKLQSVESRIRRQHDRRRLSPVPPSPHNLKDW